MTKLGKIAIVGAAVGAGVYLAQKCMPKMSVFFAHEDDDMDAADEKEDVKEDKKEDSFDGCDGCDGHLCEIHAIPLSEAPEDVRAVIQAIDGALRKCHADAENADENDEDLNDEDLNVEDYGLTDEDFENLDMLFESDDFEQPNGQFEEPYFTV